METEEGIWSGPAQELGLPAASYLPCAFWLNAVRGEEVSATLDDTWLLPPEREKVRRLQEEFGEQTEIDIEILFGDPRCLLPASVNGSSCVALRDLSRASPAEVEGYSDARAVLLTTFDEPDVDWAVEELGLQPDTEVTLCMHPWTSLGAGPVRKASEALMAFENAEVVIPCQTLQESGDNAASAVETACTAKLEHLWAMYGLSEMESWWHDREYWWPSNNWNWGWEPPKSKEEHAADVALDQLGAVVLAVKLLPGLGKPRLPQESQSPPIRIELRRADTWEVWLRAPTSTTSPSEEARPIGSDEQLLGHADGPEASALCDVLLALGLLHINSSTSLSAVCHLLPSLSRQSGGLSASELLLSVSLSRCHFCDSAPREHVDVGPLFVALATNYGLLALEKAVASLEKGAGAWPMSEEVHFCSISSGIGGLHGPWLHDFDLCAHRDSAHGPHAGPRLIAPQPPYSDSSSLSSADPKSLCEHTAPWHATGREQIAVHNKFLVRHMRKATGGVPYGWTYLGSHNLTQAAWGTLRYPWRDAVWMSNWELGVVVGSARPSDDDQEPGSESTLADVSPFRHSPYPFGLPLGSFEQKSLELSGAWGDVSLDADAQDEEAQDAGGTSEEYREFKEFSLLHPKLLLFEHGDRLRVCIGTANLRRQSWDFQAEAVWIRDFPLRRSASNTGSTVEEERDAIFSLLLDPFARILAHFLAMLLRDSPRRRECWLRRLLRYDFADANAQLVASVPGPCPLIPCF